MPGFIYYIPGRDSGLTPADVVPLGLSYALDGPLASVGCKTGPDRRGGVLAALAASVPSERLGYHPDKQTWRKIPGTELWVGMYPTEPPDLQSLARKQQIEGHQVKMADGRRWLVPLSRAWIEEDGELRYLEKLPRHSVLDDDGRWRTGDVLGRFAALWRLAVRWEEAWWKSVVEIAGGEEEEGDSSVKVEFEFDDLHESAIEVLGYNYRIGPAEADLLGLLTWGISREIMLALVDMPTRQAWFKKNWPPRPTLARIPTMAGRTRPRLPADNDRPDRFGRRRRRPGPVRPRFGCAEVRRRKKPQRHEGTK